MNKKLFKLFFLLLMLFMLIPSISFSADGTCTIGTPARYKTGGGTIYDKVILTITCTASADNASYPLVTIDPLVYGINSYFLYNASFNPGATAPTALYDVSISLDSEVISGTLLNDRSATDTQTVNLGKGTEGFYMVDGTLTMALTNNLVNSAVTVIKLRFTAN